jgi:hypothetical protein
LPKCRNRIPTARSHSSFSLSRRSTKLNRIIKAEIIFCRRHFGNATLAAVFRCKSYLAFIMFRRITTAILFVFIVVHQLYCQKTTLIQVDKNLTLRFPGKLIIDRSEKDFIKYSSKTDNAGYQLIIMDSFEVDSRKDMHNRLNGLLDGFRERGLFLTHTERRTDTTIGTVNGVYMISTDTSGKPIYKRSQFFYTVLDRRFYGLQILLSSMDSTTLLEEKNFFSNLRFSGKPYFKPGADASNLTKIFWFIALVVVLGFLTKSIVERKRSLF